MCGFFFCPLQRESVLEIYENHPKINRFNFSKMKYNTETGVGEIRLLREAMRVLNKRRNEKYGSEWLKENAKRAIRLRWETYRLRKAAILAKLEAEQKLLLGE